ncbi:hypothetical protein CDL12_17975 [Handroanthus impetiginosus]|uniref:Uncharacterized protein n=1 Tax=Handroanthus impetiginosus TaxID=429701 RepID=A0A2G9GVW9_9LAMI|nr:hypothetical protein CDL12_17975 [Handroanthus impetiginosus]
MKMYEKKQNKRDNYLNNPEGETSKQKIPRGRIFPISYPQMASDKEIVNQLCMGKKGRTHSTPRTSYPTRERQLPTKSEVICCYPYIPQDPLICFAYPPSSTQVTMDCRLLETDNASRV